MTAISHQLSHQCSSEVMRRALALLEAVETMETLDERFEGEIPLTAISKTYRTAATLRAALNESPKPATITIKLEIE